MIGSLFGLALFAMQSAAPDRVVLSVHGPQCGYWVDGTAETLDEIDALAGKWSYGQPEIELRADPDTRFACLDPLLKLLRRYDLTRLGFVGNEVAGDKE